MEYRFQKLIVQPVIGEFDEEGTLIGERPANAVPVYTREQLLAFFDSIPIEVAQLNAQVAEAAPNRATRRARAKQK